MSGRRLQAVLDGAAPWHVETCDVLDGLRMLPDKCVQSCVTSPPYWGLRDYGVDGQLGLEKTPTEFVAAMTEVFREVRRVLRDDGTLWLNIGDSYCSTDKWGGGGNVGKQTVAADGSVPSWESTRAKKQAIEGLKPKDLVGIPWMLAFALRADGWYLRSEIIWHKRAPMPESVTDRPTKAHEQVFLLAKSRKYFYDAVAVAEESICDRIRGPAEHPDLLSTNGNAGLGRREPDGTRNLRSVWTLSPESFSGAHFATMPTELARKALLAGTSAKGCCAACGTPWRRVTEKNRTATRDAENSKVLAARKLNNTPGRAPTSTKTTLGSIVGNRDPERHVTTVETIGWEAGCKCGAPPMPCLVLDNFNGAGTTGVVARRLGLRYIGFELNPEYAEMARQRIRDDSPLFNATPTEEQQGA